MRWLGKEKEVKEMYHPGDKLKAKRTIQFYGIAKDIVYTVSAWQGWEIDFEEIPYRIYGCYFERATKEDVDKSVKLLREFIKDQKVETTVQPFVAYSHYIAKKEREEHNTSLHKALMR